jgi:transposase
MSLLASLLTSYATEVLMLDGKVLGVERRRRWPDAVKRAILAEVNTNGWSVTDVARRHDVTRQHIYQWRREMRAKVLQLATDTPMFLPVELASSPDGLPAIAGDCDAMEITVVLRNDRQLRCREGVADATLARLVRVLEAA